MVESARQRFKLLQHILFCNCAQLGVAVQTARKGRERAGQIETPQDFQRLLVRVLRAWKIAGFDNTVHQQPPITGQERPVFASHQVEQLPIIRLLVVGDIEAKKAQIASQFS